MLKHKRGPRKQGKGKKRPRKGPRKAGGRDPYAKKFPVSNGIVIRSIGHNPIPKYCDVTFYGAYDSIVTANLMSTADGGFYGSQLVKAYPYRPFIFVTGPTAITGNSYTASCLAWDNFMTPNTGLGTGGGLFSKCFPKSSKLTLEAIVQPSAVTDVGLDQFQVAVVPLGIGGTDPDPQVTNMQQALVAPNSKSIDIDTYQKGRLVCYTDTMKMAGKTFSQCYSDESSYSGYQASSPQVLEGYQLCFQSLSNLLPTSNIIIRMTISVPCRIYDPARTEQSE